MTPHKTPCLFTGIQIHGPDNVTYVWPEASYAVVDGQRYEFPRGKEIDPYAAGLQQPVNSESDEVAS